MNQPTAFLDGQFSEILPHYVDDRQLNLPPNAMQVLSKRYLWKKDGKVETPAGMFYRVARWVGLGDIANGASERIAEVTVERFYDLLASGKFLPNSPTFTGAGTPLGQLAACFVLPLEDDMGVHEDGIFSILRKAVLIQKTGGGNGFSFGRLRPKGALVSTSGGVATGPVGFLGVYDKAFGEVAQGGSRRGANMAVLPVWHPDIEEFITCKANEGKIANFNISVAITDDFMDCVKHDLHFELLNPHYDPASTAVPRVAKVVKARDLFKLIVKHAHQNGEPGALFIDTANDSNPVPHIAQYEATNPCGEQWLLPYENCCLGSINLAKHWRKDSDGDVNVDWLSLALTIADATHFLDNVVTVNSYVPAVPELKEAGQRARRIGLGIMGLGDLFYAMGIRYGSQAAQELAAQIMEFVRYHAMLKSVRLAAMRGSFPAYYGSIYEQGQWEVPQSIIPYSMNFGRPPLYWTDLKIQMAEHGIRNAAQTTIAPTGTLSTVSGVEGYGCEPVFALGYIRHFKDGDNDVELNYTSPLFAAALDTVSWLSDARKEEIRQHVATYGSCQDIPDLPESIRHTFVVTNDITAEEHVRMQAAMQAFVDNSISKTVNFPSSATEADVATAYQLAWDLGCKGLTVYIEGSRQQVVLETKATQQAKAKEAGDGLRIQSKEAGNISIRPDVVVEMPMRIDLSTLTPKRKRPNALHGTTYRKATPLGKAYVTVNSDDEGEPLEVFVNVGKAGSETAAISEAFGRLISLVLRLHSDITPTARLSMIEEMLRGIGGGRALGFGPNKIASLPDGIARVLKEHMQRDAVATIIELETGAQAEPPQLVKSHLFAEICPECGEASFINTEGCKKCHDCGYSEC